MRTHTVLTHGPQHKARHGPHDGPQQGTECERFNKALRSTSSAFRGGSKHLHNVLFGGVRTLEVVIGAKQVLLRGKRSTSEQWTPAQHATSLLAKQAREFLQNCGWTNVRHKWSHVQLGLEWNLGRPSQHLVAHQLREAWRAQQWNLFVNANRRDSRALRHVAYNSQRVGLVREVLQSTQGATAAVLTGSFFSPAAFSVRPGIPRGALDLPSVRLPESRSGAPFLDLPPEENGWSSSRCAASSARMAAHQAGPPGGDDNYSGGGVVSKTRRHKRSMDSHRIQAQRLSRESLLAQYQAERQAPFRLRPRPVMLLSGAIRQQLKNRHPHVHVEYVCSRGVFVRPRVGA